MSESESPVISSPTPKAHGPLTNQDWWPNQPDLQVLRKHAAPVTPMGDDFNYAKEFETLDVEALAVLNATLHLARLDPRELLVTLDLREERAILCLLSERGPVVVRYLEVGGHPDVAAPAARAPLTAPGEDVDAGQAGEAYRGTVRRIADEIRTSLAFYRSEYDRESLPRYLLSGWLPVRQLNRWLTDELRLESPFEVIDPFRAAPMTAAQGATDASAGPEFVQAFGLALRAL